MKTGLPHSRFYTEPSYYKALGFNHDNKHGCKTIANFARREGTSQRALQNKAVSVCWNCATLEVNGGTENLKMKETQRTEDFGPETEAAEHNLHKLSQDPGKGYTFSESRTEKLHPPVEGTYKEICLSLWWEKIQNKMASWSSGQYYVTTQIGKEFEK